MHAGTEAPTRAFLLRSVDYGEADRIVTLFTEDFGRVGAIARGARRSRKRFGGTLEPCAVLEVELGKSKGSLLRLASARLLQPFPALLTDLGRIQGIGQASELVRRATPEGDPEPGVFAALLTFHEVLRDARGEAIEVALLAFALRVLALLGLAPQLDLCAVSGVACPADQLALFDPARGGIVRQRFGGGPYPLAATTRARMRAAMMDTWAEEFAAWDSTSLAEASAAVDAFLRRHQLRGDRARG